MSDQTDNLISVLTPFNLTQDEARIYLGLLEKRVMTALALSREMNIGRTKVYRILDKLIEKQLVIQKLDSAGFKFVANDPSSLQYLLNKQEVEIANLKKSLPGTIKTLQEKVGIDVPGSRILYYRGIDGLSRVNWNVLRAKGELLSYEVATADAYLPQQEAEKLRQGLVDYKITTKTITNKSRFKPFTEVSEMVEKYWRIRYLPKKIINIETDVFIYNDIFAVCHYLKKGDIFCFEMQNQQVTDMQRQIFKTLWLQAKELKKVGNKGEARLG